jgi:hypothetical protein
MAREAYQMEVKLHIPGCIAAPVRGKMHTFQSVRPDRRKEEGSMRKPLVASLALSLLGAAGSAFAGTVYVPVPDPVGSTGSSHALQVWITNSGPQQRPYTAHFLEAETDGTRRPAKLTETPLAAGRTTLLTGIGVRGKLGLLEIDANPQMSIEARLVNTSPGGQITVSMVPVISSDNVFAAGGTAVVQGLGRDGARGDSSSLGIVNLGQQGAQCQVKVFRADGSQIGATATLTFSPLSLSFFADAFAILGVQQVADARFQVSCSQPFYTFATIFQQSNAQVAFVLPSASGESTLTRPGVDNQPPPAAGAVVFSRPGLIHTVTRQKEKEQIFIDLEQDLSLRRLVLDMEFTPGPWNTTKIPGNHAIVWLYREKFRGNTIANVNAFGPDKFSLKASQNINLAPRALTVSETGVPWEQGRRYHLKYTYDAELNRVFVVLSAGGTTLKSFDFAGTTPNGVLTVPAKGLTVDFGHYSTQFEGPEVASFGWSYWDLRIEMIPR